MSAKSTTLKPHDYFHLLFGAILGIWFVFTLSERIVVSSVLGTVCGAGGMTMALIFMRIGKIDIELDTQVQIVGANFWRVIVTLATGLLFMLIGLILFPTEPSLLALPFLLGLYFAVYATYLRGKYLAKKSEGTELGGEEKVSGTFLEN